MINVSDSALSLTREEYRMDVWYSRRVARYGVRQKAGTLVHDWPRFLRSMASKDGWVRFRNRHERLSIDAKTGGVRCEWMFTSDLHLCAVYPATASWLLRRAASRWPVESAERPAAVEAEPRVSFVIGHRGEARAPHLLQTLASIAAQRDVAIECIVVEQSARPVIQSRLPEWVRYLHTPVVSDDSPYNRSQALNAGAAAARAPLLVLHDNDFLVPARYAAELVRRHDDGYEIIDLKRFMFYLPPDQRFDSGAVPERVVQNLLAGGSVAADRRAYAEIGGFDESFVGWGGEDNEFWDRASTRRVYAFGYLPLVHLWHAPQPEKAANEADAGRARREALARIPREERIAMLRGTR